MNKLLQKSRGNLRNSRESYGNRSDRSKSKENSITELKNSRAKILGNIADKLKENKNVYASMGNSRKIETPVKADSGKQKLNKLDTLLKDVKKYNK